MVLKEKLTPIERLMKKSFDEMTKGEFTKIRIMSSFAFGFLCALIGFLIDKLLANPKSVGSYFAITIFLTIGWYFIFFMIFCKIRKIKK